jgi:hypothetical protein
LTTYNSFSCDELVDLVNALQLPAFFITHNRYLVSSLEAVSLLCARLKSTGDIWELVERYDRSQSAMSEIINEIAITVDDRWGFLLGFDPVLLHPERLQEWADAIYQRGSPLPTVWAFIDCTIRQICRPIFGQRAVYSGHKKFHALKFQALMVPCGLIAHLFGPWEGRRSDNFLLRMSGLLDKCSRHAVCPGTDENTPLIDRHFQIYGDAAYALSPVLISPFSGPGERSQEEKDFNAAMSGVRIEVEHGFAVVLGCWPGLRCFWKHRPFSSPVGRYYRVGVLLTNARTCIRGGNQVSDYFGCVPPTLIEYFHN